MCNSHLHVCWLPKQLDEMLFQVAGSSAFPWFTFLHLASLAGKLEGSVHFGSPSTGCSGSPPECLQGSVCEKKMKNCRKRLKTRMKIGHLIRFDAPLCKCSQAKDLCCVLGHCCCCWLLQAFHGQEPLFTNYALSGSQTEPFVATLDAQIN